MDEINRDARKKALEQIENKYKNSKPKKVTIVLPDTILGALSIIASESRGNYDASPYLDMAGNVKIYEYLKDIIIEFYYNYLTDQITTDIQNENKK